MPFPAAGSAPMWVSGPYQLYLQSILDIRKSSKHFVPNLVWFFFYIIRRMVFGLMKISFSTTMWQKWSLEFGVGIWGFVFTLFHFVCLFWGVYLWGCVCVCGVCVCVFVSCIFYILVVLFFYWGFFFGGRVVVYCFSLFFICWRLMKVLFLLVSVFLLLQCCTWHFYDYKMREEIWNHVTSTWFYFGCWSSHWYKWNIRRRFHCW